MQRTGEQKATEDGPEERDAEGVVRCNISWMLTLAERILQDRHLAEDAVQDAFLNFFRGLKDFEGRSDLKTWLHRITVNASLTKLRQVDRLKEQDIEVHLPEFDQNDCRVESLWPYIATLEDVLAKEELRAFVIDAINALPDAYRIVLQLRDIEEYSTSEVASLCELSEANVKVRLHRARAALKKRLEPLLRGGIAP